MMEGGKLIEDGKMIGSGKKKVQQPDWKGMPEMDLSEAALTDVHALQQALQQQIAETKAWKDRYHYLRSDLEKTRMRLERFAKKRIRREKDKVLMEFLPLVDDLERATLKRTVEGAQIKDCLVLALSELQGILAQNGVKQIDALNQPFDPKFHEARGIAHNIGVNPGKVIQVIQNGYTCEERLLRPVEVLVSA